MDRTRQLLACHAITHNRTQSHAITRTRTHSQALWTELVNCLRLSHGNAEGLPEPLLVLLPPAPHSGWSVAMPETMASEWLRRWEYPPVRRAQVCAP